LADIAQVNVKNFGAKGDGITDDRNAVLSAFDYAIAHLPADVYFPKGDYGILHGGMYLKLPLGSDGLRIRGAGARQSRIKYLDGWEPNGSWVAIRVEPISTPTTEDEYLKNITIQDLGVWDTNPVEHAWNIAEGDSGTEETHGFSIKYCKNFMMLHCGVWSVGDEAIEINSCKGALIDGNYFYNCPGAGASGGAVSVAGGSENVRIVNNFIDTPIQSKSNFGFNIETVEAFPVQNIIFANNIIKNVVGSAINISAMQATISNIEIQSNEIYNCTIGVNITGSNIISNVSIDNLIVKNATNAVYANATSIVNTNISGLIADAISDVCIYHTGFDKAFISNCKLSNLQTQAIWISATKGVIENIIIDGVGLAGSVTLPAIQAFTSGLDTIVRNVRLINCLNKTAIQNIDTIINTCIEMQEIVGYVAISNVKFVQGGVVNGIIRGLLTGSIIRDVYLSMTTDPGNHGIVIADVTDCIVTGCNVTIPSRYGIRETGTANYNVVTNNNVRNSGLKLSVIGANSVQANNLV
jgi:hypothetical protein